MSLYFKFEEDTMKNEIPAAIFLVPPPPPPPPRDLQQWIRLCLITT